LSVIVFQIDPLRILALPFEGDAPRSVDMHAVALGFALQGVEVETRQIQRFRGLGGVDGVQPPQYSRHQGRLHLGALAFSTNSSSPLCMNDSIMG